MGHIAFVNLSHLKKRTRAVQFMQCHCEACCPSEVNWTLEAKPWLPKTFGTWCKRRKKKWLLVGEHVLPGVCMGRRVAVRTATGRAWLRAGQDQGQIQWSQDPPQHGNVDLFRFHSGLEGREDNCCCCCCCCIFFGGGGVKSRNLRGSSTSVDQLGQSPTCISPIS